MANTTTPQREEQYNLWEKHEYYFTFGILMLVIYSVVIFASTLFGSSYIKWLCIYGVIIHLVDSLAARVKKDEIGALFFLDGHPLMRVGGGWIYVPRFLVSLDKVTRGVIQIVTGTEVRDRNDAPAEDYDISTTMLIMRERTPERITFGDIDVVPEGYATGEDPIPKFPLPRITSGPGGARERLKKGKINKMITCDPLMIAEFQVIEPISFFINVGKVEILSKRVALNSVAALNESAPRIPLGLAQENKSILEARVSHRIEQLVGEKPINEGTDKEKCTPNWGIDFIRFSIKEWGIPHTLNTAIKENNQSGFVKEKDITISEGTMQKRINEGIGEASALKALELARGEGLTKMAEIANSGPGGFALVQGNQLVQATNKASTTIISPNLGQLEGAVGLASALFNKNPLTQPTPAPTANQSQSAQPAPAAQPQNQQTPRPGFKSRRNRNPNPPATPNP